MKGEGRSSALLYRLWCTRIISILFILSLFQTIPVSQAADGKNKYYVSPSGNDSNAGTMSAPWRTIQKAADTLEPGDTVYVRGGVYDELVTISKSGSSSGGFITYRNFLNEVPIIEGKSFSPLARSEALIRMSDVDYIRIEGLEIRGLSSDSSSSDPAGIRLTGRGHHIKILNNNIHDIANTARRGNAHGIHVLGTSKVAISQLDIIGNKVHHLLTGRSESVTLSGNIDGFLVDGNEVHDNNNIGIVLAGHYRANSDPNLDQTRNGVVSNNTIYRIDSSRNIEYGTDIHAAGGIYVDGGKDIVIERNRTYANDFGIEIASENKGKNSSGIIVRNNYIHHNDGAGLIMGGSGPSRGGAVNNVIMNNTIVENDTFKQGFGDVVLQWNNSNNKIYNNIIVSNSQGIAIKKGNKSGSNNKVDYNLLYNSNGKLSNSWKWDGVTYNSWSKYKEATGNDANSIFANPMFVDLKNNDIQLRPQSPAINRGLNSIIDKTSYDYAGKTRLRGPQVDIGALEHESDKKTPTAIIQIDAVNKDWSDIAALSTANAGIDKLKAVVDQSILFLSAEGKEKISKNQIYIDSDNSAATGFHVRYWESSGADYLVENGKVYQYTGSDGKEWSWEVVTDLKANNQYTISETFIELGLPLGELKLSPSSRIRVGYVRNDADKGKLPTGNSMASIQLNKK